MKGVVMRSIIVRFFLLLVLFFPALASSATPTTSLTGLWWNPNESGWGMSLTQQGTTVFAAWYTYNSAGKPTWLVMSSCPVVGSSCTGDIYDVRGGTPLALPWNGSGKIVTKVGTGTLAFTDNNTGAFNYSVNGASGTKQIVRQMFATGTTQPATDYSALWWNEDESGWGVAITQQYETIFATMYSYDVSGNPVWYVASNCPLSSNGCTGDLYQVTGGSAPDAAWNANLAVTQVGTVSFILNDNCTGTMTYTINGVTTTKAITNQLPAANQCAAGTVAAKTTAGVCAATLSQDLTLQIPQFFIAGTPYSATLKITQSSDGSYTTKVTSFGPTSRADCSDGDAGIIVISNNTYMLHVPSFIFGTNQYWANFEYIPSAGETISLANAAASVSGAGSTLKITKYGNAVADVTGEGSAFISLSQVTATSAQILSATPLPRTVAQSPVRTAQAVGNFDYEIKESFPGGVDAHLKLTALQNQYTPTAEEVSLASQLGVNVYNVKMTYSATVDGFNLQLQYFVPNSALSLSSAANLVQALSSDARVKPQPKSEAQQLAVPADRSALAEGGTQSGVNVVLVATITEGFKGAFESLVASGFGKTKRYGGKLGETLAKDGTNGGDAFMDIVAATDIKAEHEKWMKRLAAAKDCADNPEVPYGAGDKERVQATVSTSQMNLKMNTAVRFLNQMAKTGLGLVADKVPGLNYVASGIAAHSDDALKTLSEMDVKTAENGVSCKKAYQAGNGTNDTLTFSGVICNLAQPFTLKSLSGTRSTYFYLIPGNGTGMFGSYTNATIVSARCDAKGMGDYTISRGNDGALLVYLKGSVTVTCLNTGSFSSVEAYDLTLIPTVAACP